MTTEYPLTPEEVAFWHLLDDETLSEAARTILWEAEYAAHVNYLVDNYIFSPEEYDEAMEKMQLAAAELTDSEHKLLARCWRAALAAAASIDSEDGDTPVWYRVSLGHLHWYYRMLSRMVEEVLEEKRRAERYR